MSGRLQRLFELLDLLKTGRPNLDYLSTALKVSSRTVLRNIDELRELGFVIDFDQEKGRYVISGSMMLPTIQFTLEESLTLISLCFEAGREIPFLGPARMAAMKLQNILPRNLQQEVQELGNALMIQPPPVNPLTESRSTFETILSAIQRRCPVRIRYKSPVEPEFETLLHPYYLYFGRHTWYAIARSSLHREVRMFHLGRILSIEETEETFEFPKGFTLKQFFGNAWCMIRERGRDQEVVVRFSPRVAQNVAEVSWHPTQRILRNNDGSIDFHVTVSGVNEISWWILGYGKEAEVLKPEKLRDTIRGHVEAMIEKYR